MLILFASEIAACIGENRYQTPGEAARKIFIRNYPDRYKQIEDEISGSRIDVDISEIVNKYKVNEKVQDTLNVSESIDRKKSIDLIAKDLIEKNKKSTVEVIEKLADENGFLLNKDLVKELVPECKRETVGKLIAETMDMLEHASDSLEKQKIVQDQVETIKEHIHLPELTDTVAKLTTLVNTSRGTRDETIALDRQQEETKKIIGNRNDKFYKISIPLPENPHGERQFMIGGRVDGIDEDGVLIEVKNRQNRIFSSIPDYELVQVQIYLKLTNSQTAHLVQKYKGQIDTKVIQYDERIWEKIVNACSLFVIRFFKVLKDPVALRHLVLDKTF